jgi:retron-type reverse transcriptase
MTDFEKVFDFGNLYTAFRKARLGKRGKESVAKFEANLMEALIFLSEHLKNKTYRLSPYNCFYVYEPKKRLVMSNAFKDKVVQHSLCDNIIEPVFQKNFILDNYAVQVGKGTHYGLNRLREFMRSYFFSRKAKTDADRKTAGLPPMRTEYGNYADGWVLKCDISKYFYSIPHEKLKEMVRKYLKDPDVLWLTEMIIDSTDCPGIPIGNQSSQWFAIAYLNEFDHFIKEKLRVKYYGRYMDDFFLIHEDKNYLRHCRAEIENYLGGLGLKLNTKTNIFPLRNGIDFCGFHSYLTDTGKAK